MYVTLCRSPVVYVILEARKQVGILGYERGKLLPA